MAARALAHEPVRVVDDQWGSPTSAHDLADHIIDLMTIGVPAGTYHGTNGGAATWFDLARAVYEELGADAALVSPVASDGFPTRARRPAWSVLGRDATIREGATPMRGWREALADVVVRIAREPMGD
jgi:dTDP-4-dehydrorhamnose reductase